MSRAAAVASHAPALLVGGWLGVATFGAWLLLVPLSIVAGVMLVWRVAWSTP